VQVARFQEDPECRLIVCSLDAAGIGITLTAASNVAFLEMGWTPATHDQAEDRVHRIGQHNAVTAWYLLAADTIDERIAAVVERKRRLVRAASDGTPHDDESALDELLGWVAEQTDTS
jgi:SWI/SNF-related matrix-associated actin-dependent regulator 1 of chromatin subfamily A